MARSLVAREILAMTGGQPVWRQGVTTDNGNWLLDVHGLAITDPLALETALNQIPGVVSVGLFAKRAADVVIVGGEPPILL
jgi:ribose 5-phosphate isomerase A